MDIVVCVKRRRLVEDDFAGLHETNTRTETAKVRQCLVVVRGDLRSFQDSIVERRVTVGDQDHGVAMGKRSTDCRVDTEIALQSTGDQALDASGLQYRLKIGLEEGVRGGLSHTDVVRLRDHLVKDLPSGSSILKRPFGFFMLNQNHGTPAARALLET